MFSSNTLEKLARRELSLFKRKKELHRLIADTERVAGQKLLDDSDEVEDDGTEALAALNKLQIQIRQIEAGIKEASVRRQKEVEVKRAAEAEDVQRKITEAEAKLKQIEVEAKAHLAGLSAVLGGNYFYERFARNPVWDAPNVATLQSELSTLSTQLGSLQSPAPDCGEYTSCEAVQADDELVIAVLSSYASAGPSTQEIIDWLSAVRRTVRGCDATIDLEAVPRRVHLAWDRGRLLWEKCDMYIPTLVPQMMSERFPGQVSGWDTERGRFHAGAPKGAAQYNDQSS